MKKIYFYNHFRRLSKKSRQLLSPRWDEPFTVLRIFPERERNWPTSFSLNASGKHDVKKNCFVERQILRKFLYFMAKFFKKRSHSAKDLDRKLYNMKQNNRKAEVKKGVIVAKLKFNWKEVAFISKLVKHLLKCVNTRISQAIGRYLFFQFRKKKL